jgi:hypothetical protein
MRSQIDQDKKEGIISLLLFKRRKILNDVLISSFGRAVHCSVKRGILVDKTKTFKLINEWMSGLPLNNEKRLNKMQLDLIVDLFIFIGKGVLMVRFLQLV